MLGSVMAVIQINDAFTDFLNPTPSMFFRLRYREINLYGGRKILRPYIVDRKILM